MSYLKTINIQHLSSGTNNIVLDANGNMTCAGTISAATPTGGMRNKIINGDMRIDQRNAGAAVTVSTSFYSLDRWATNSTQANKYSFQQNAGSITPPAGFTNYLGVTSISTYSVAPTDWFTLQQGIEGNNIADLDWGKSTAKSITLSFWVRSSLTGLFGGSVVNSDVTRSYPYTYTINTANTWEYKTITIPGDTTGTWLTTNGVGIRLYINLGSGSSQTGPANTWASAFYNGPNGATSVVATNGATFYITGVQVETGTVATAFERRSYGAELALCQRYYLSFGPFGKGLSADYHPLFYCYGLPNMTNTTWFFGIPFPIVMRSSPTLVWSGVGTLILDNGSPNPVTALTTQRTNPMTASIYATTSSIAGSSAGNMLSANNNTTAYVSFSSEL